jgi:hypothetical protein
MTDIERSIIINTLVKAIKSGKMTIEQVDEEYKADVTARLQG